MFWNEDEKKYWMLIATRLREGPERRRGAVALATSDDLLTWSVPKPIYIPWNTMCPECPEMFKLGSWWYLVYSHFSEDANTTYRVSKSCHGPWRVPPTPGVDGRRFYAAKSMPGVNRRIMWGSVYERIALNDESDWTYGGDFGIPRQLTSMKDGSLAVSIPPEVRASFGTELKWDFKAKAGNWQKADNGIKVKSEQALANGFFTGVQEPTVLFDFTAKLEEGLGVFGVLFKSDEDFNRAHGLVFDPVRGRVAITQWPQSLDPFWASLTKAWTPSMEIDGPRMVERPLELRAGKSIRCSVCMDGSLLEVFVDNRIALTYRLYGSKISVYQFGLFVEDGSAAFTGVRFARQ